MAEAWEDLPDVVPAKESWEDLPDVDPHVTAPAQTTADDEATKNAYTKEAALENALTFFGNGGPTAIMKGAQSAMQWPHPASGAREGEGPLDLFRRRRDETRRAMSLAERHGPHAEVGGVKFNPVALAGAAAPSLAAPNPVSWLGRLALGGVLGGEQAAIQSDADLTKGEVLPFLKDTGRGALYGAGGAGVAEGIAAPMRLIGKGAASRIGGVVNEQAGKDAAAVADEVAKLRGAAGRTSTALNRAGENTRGIIGGSPTPGSTAIDPALHQRALLQLSDPDFVAAQSRTLENTLDDFSANVARDQAANAAYKSALSTQGADAAKRTADFFSKPTLGTDVMPRVGRQLQNGAVGFLSSVPSAALAAVGGHSMGGAAGGALGAGAFLLQGLNKGLNKGALSAARTTLANPRLQVGALEGMIQASQAGQKALQAGARSGAAAAPEAMEQEKEDAVQAFLSGG